MAKIVVITSNIAPYRLRWCEELSKFYEVEIVYTKDHDYERDDRWLQKSSDSCKIHKLNNPKDLYDPVCFDVIDVIKKNKDALIIFDGYGPKTNLIGLTYCKMKGIETFTNVDGYALGEERSRLKDMIKNFVISKLCTNFFCSSDSTKKHLIECGANKDNIYVHNFSSICNDQIIDKPLTHKEKMAVRRKLNIDTDKPIVISVGAFIPRKRYEDLIKAIKKVKSDCELYLVGGKATEEYLRLADNDPRIHFVDFVLPSEVDEYYLASDLFVLPSQTDVWGLVLNEAMAKGLPVIASDNCVAAKSLIDGNGIEYRTGNVDQLIEAIDVCLDKDNNKRMSLRSLEIIKDFTIENMVVRQKDAINKFIKV